MSTTQQDKQGSKSRRSRRKKDERGQQLDQAGILREQDLKLDPNSEQPIGTIMAADAAINEASAEPAVSALSVQADIPLVAPAEAPSMKPGTPADNTPIGMQAIANAYRSYAHKSLQQTGAFAEKLMGARSFDKAIEAQTEFARQAYANLVADSQNIWQLHSRMAKQTFNSWQCLAMGTRNR